MRKVLLYSMIAISLVLTAAIPRMPLAAEENTTVSIFGEARRSAGLFQSEESGATLLGGEGDFFLQSARESSGESGGLVFQTSFELGGQGYSEVWFRSGYLARDLRFDAAPFRSNEYPGQDWLARELLLQEGIFEQTDFAAYDLPPAYPELYLPTAVPLKDFQFETLADRRYNQYLLDSTGLPVLSEIWHLPIDAKVFHLEEAYAELEGFHAVSDLFFIHAALTPSVGREQNAPPGFESSFIEGSLGLGLSMESLTIAVGATYTEDFGEPAVLPSLLVQWRPVDWFHLEIDLPDSFAANFWWNEDLGFSLGVDLNGSGYGLAPRGAAEARDQLFITTVDTSIGFSYSPSDALAFELKAGATVFEEYELYRRGSLLYKYEGETGSFARFVVTLALIEEAEDDFE